MGCGFSTEDTKASDEERILKASDGVTGKAETTAQTRMGGTLAKKSPAKKRRGDSKCKEQGDFLIFLTFFFCFLFFFLLIVVTASVTRKRADIIYKYILMFILK